MLLLAILNVNEKLWSINSIAYVERKRAVHHKEAHIISWKASQAKATKYVAGDPQHTDSAHNRVEATKLPSLEGN